MKIEPNIIDVKIEKEGLYADTTVNALQEKLDTINFQLDSVNILLNENNILSVDEKNRLLAEKSRLEDKKVEIEQKILKLKEHKKEEVELESAESFKGCLDEKEEELYSARSIGKAFVPTVATVDKKKAREFDKDFENASEAAKKVNDEFSKKAEDLMAKMDDLFR